ncbi:UNVERIFIED_ORG: hypothetical protein ABIB52_000926 [Arthrobacter sp. UYCu721]
MNLPYSAALSSWAQLRGIHRAAKFTHPGQGGVEVLHPEEQVGQRALVTAVQPARDAGVPITDPPSPDGPGRKVPP